MFISRVISKCKYVGDTSWYFMVLCSKKLANWEKTGRSVELSVHKNKVFSRKLLLRIASTLQNMEVENSNELYPDTIFAGLEKTSKNLPARTIENVWCCPDLLPKVKKSLKIVFFCLESWHLFWVRECILSATEKCSKRTTAKKWTPSKNPACNDQRHKRSCNIKYMCFWRGHFSSHECCLRKWILLWVSEKFKKSKYFYWLYPSINWKGFSLINLHQTQVLLKMCNPDIRLALGFNLYVLFFSKLSDFFCHLLIIASLLS